jgi:hypothetical protein
MLEVNFALYHLDLWSIAGELHPAEKTGTRAVALTMAAPDLEVATPRSPSIVYN